MQNIVSPEGVSIIIVNWNTREMVLRLLATLSAPDDDSAQELELIVVDNDSHDGSVEAIRREFPAVKLLAQSKNLGFAGGVNRGIEVATQPFVLLLNSDAETSRASVAESARYMADHPQVGILGPRVLSPDGSPLSTCWRDPSLVWIVLRAVGLSRMKIFNFERYGEKVFTEPTEVDCVCGCALMIRRDLLLELGGLDEDYFMYFEETDLCVRARRRGMQVHHAPIGEFVHQGRGTAKTVRLRTYLDSRRSHILFHRKHSGDGAAIMARGLLALGNALRVPPLAVLSWMGGSERTREQLRVNWKGLRWLLNPFGGLVPDVDRSD
jgi:GT2 family glycosyltransferase